MVGLGIVILIFYGMWAIIQEDKEHKEIKQHGKIIS